MSDGLSALRLAPCSDGTGVEQSANARGDVGENEGGGAARLETLRRARQIRIVRHHAQVNGGLAERVVWRARTRIDAGELDVGMAEAGTVEEQAEGVEELPVGAVIRPQRGPLGAAHGVEIGVHVGAPEAEDRLLRIADRDQSMTGEGAVEDLPLQPVGVLELVDQARGGSGRRAGRRAVVRHGDRRAPRRGR